MEWTGSTLYTSLGSESRSYFDADERMRVFQQYESRWKPDNSFGTSAGMWEEYRYDPLGRRIQVATRRGPDLCDVDATTCISSTTRFVWAGDQILWERKTADGSKADEAGGLVSYFQAGGIDRPLVITKGGTSVVPHQNWRGAFARGTFASGTRAGQSSDCATYPPSNGCLPISWPGWATTAWHDDAGKQPTTGYVHYWFGSQAVGMRDASGQMYMRNRYYDPATGQFTQPDPIGLAGGLNSYGFAGGDPVSYSDPFGLCKERDKICKVFVRQLRELARSTDNPNFATAANVLDKANDRVVFVDPSDRRLGGAMAATANGCGFLGFGRCVYLRSDLGPGDQVAAVAHEANYHVRYGVALPDARQVTDGYAFDVSIQQSLPAHYQPTTVLNRQRLRALGVKF